MAYKWALALATAAVQWGVYYTLGRAPFPRSTTLLETAIDRAIPLWPATTWFYLPFYVAIPVLTVIGVQSRPLYHRTIAAVLANWAICLVGYLAVPAEYPRPAVLPPYPDASTAFLAFVQRIDPPGNVFPSLHVAHGLAMALILLGHRPSFGRPMLAMAVLLALSTLTTKQHFLADVAGGLFVAVATSRWALRRETAAPAAAALAPQKRRAAGGT